MDSGQTSIDLIDIHSGIGPGTSGPARRPADEDEAGGERRRFYRYPVHVSGFLALGENHPARCVVWDFSGQGMRASRALQSAVDPAISLAPATPGDPVRLALRIPGIERAATVTGFVRRIRADREAENLGIRLETLEREVFAALIAHADALQDEIGTLDVAFRDATGWAFVAGYLQVLASECSRRVQERLLLETEWGDDWDARTRSFYATVELKSAEPLLMLLVGRMFLRAAGLRRDVVAQFDRLVQVQEGDAAASLGALAKLGVPFPDGVLRGRHCLLRPEVLTRLFAEASQRVDIPEQARPYLGHTVEQVAELLWRVATASSRRHRAA